MLYVDFSECRHDRRDIWSDTCFKDSRSSRQRKRPAGTIKNLPILPHVKSSFLPQPRRTLQKPHSKPSLPGTAFFMRSVSGLVHRHRVQPAKKIPERRTEVTQALQECSS